MSTDRPGCSAYQVSDQMMCALCRLVWDTNDAEPPPCNARTHQTSTVQHAARAIAAHRWRRRFDYGPNVTIGYRKRVPYRNPSR